MSSAISINKNAAIRHRTSGQIIRILTHMVDHDCGNRCVTSSTARSPYLALEIVVREKHHVERRNHRTPIVIKDIFVFNSSGRNLAALVCIAAAIAAPN